MCCGLAGGLFARLLVVSLSGLSRDRFTRWRQKYPVRFGAACGLAVAVIAGSVASTVLSLLVVPGIYFLLKQGWKEDDDALDGEPARLHAVSPDPEPALVGADA